MVKHRRTFKVGALAAFLAFAGSACSLPASSASISAAKPLSGLQKVDRITDGDTFAVKTGDGSTQRIRVAYIDTPETQGGRTECGGAQASKLMKKLLRPGDTVKLKPVDMDRYGRTVAETFKAKKNLGLTLVQQGWAMVYRFQGRDFAGSAAYDNAARTARLQRKGVWESCAGNFHFPI